VLRPCKAKNPASTPLQKQTAPPKSPRMQLHKQCCGLSQEEDDEEEVKTRGTPCLYVFPDAEPVAMRESSSQRKK
jgi:hypothetical protein